MKYLHDDGLQELTAILTDCPVSNNPRSNSRLLHGRLEAYTMKRAGTDKKYAWALGHQEQEWMQQPDMANAPNSITGTTTTTGRKRSVSTGEAPSHSASSKNQKTTTTTTNGGRGRCNSLDNVPLQSISSNPTPTTTTLSPVGTVVHRRLLTDLILTLNGSFPDYDFATATAADFPQCTVATAVQSINLRLGELAVQQQQHQQQGDCHTNDASSSSTTCFLSNLWSAVDKVINLSQVSAVYSYQPVTDSSSSDPLSFLKQTLLQDSSWNGTTTTTQEEEECPVDVVVAEHNYYEDDDCDDGTNYDDCASTTTQSKEGEVLWTFNYFFVNKQAKRILLFTCIETMMRSCYGGGVGDGHTTTAAAEEHHPATIPEHEAVTYHNGVSLLSTSNNNHELPTWFRRRESVGSDQQPSNVARDDTMTMPQKTSTTTTRPKYEY